MSEEKKTYLTKTNTWLEKMYLFHAHMLNYNVCTWCWVCSFLFIRNYSALVECQSIGIETFSDFKGASVLSETSTIANSTYFACNWFLLKIFLLEQNGRYNAIFFAVIFCGRKRLHTFNEIENYDVTLFLFRFSSLPDTVH